MHRNRTRSRGMALIEALVAMTVMAFGMLAVVGLQGTLRQNADVAKQRSEAVRIAQEEVERWRAYPSLQGASGTVAYDNLANGSGTSTADTYSNTSYSITRSVTTPSDVTYKVLHVDVGWTDRNGVTQSVRLSTAVHGVEPQLAGTVSVPAYGTPTAQAGGRNRSIPITAKQLDATRSGFMPPQAASPNSVVWVFNNVTGLITVCSTSAATTADLDLDNITNCNTGYAQLLTGFVNFAQDDTTLQPTAANAELPLSASLPVQVNVLRTFPASLTVACFTEQRSLYVVYYCAVPVDATPPTQRWWSGRVVVVGVSGLTGDPAETSASRLRVCRYTRFQDDRTVVSGTIKNEEHPLDYYQLASPLANQNFLIIRAGSGGSAYACPADDTSTPVNTTTYRHPLTL